MMKISAGWHNAANFIHEICCCCWIHMAVDCDGGSCMANNHKADPALYLALLHNCAHLFGHIHERVAKLS